METAVAAAERFAGYAKMDQPRLTRREPDVHNGPI
jgi:hypothetical protein